MKYFVHLFFCFFSSSSIAKVCIPQFVNYCEDNKCTQTDIIKDDRIIVNTSDIQLCEKSKCTTYPAEFSKSGVFTNVSIGNRGYILKIDDEGNFMQVSSIMLKILYKVGVCR
jgi:hypothetical protein